MNDAQKQILALGYIEHATNKHIHAKAIEDGMSVLKEVEDIYQEIKYCYKLIHQALNEQAISPSMLVFLNQDTLVKFQVVEFSLPGAHSLYLIKRPMGLALRVANSADVYDIPDEFNEALYQAAESLVRERMLKDAEGE